ncbi:hypothetical protein V8F20_006956 [Naviculisporaceae sp. PSN 640]
MDLPLPTNDQIEAAKAIGAVLARRPATVHAFAGRFAVSLLQACRRPDVDLTRPLPPSPLSSGGLQTSAPGRPAPGVEPLMLVVDHHTNASAEQRSPAEPYRADYDHVITTRLVINGGDRRLFVPDYARALEGEDATFFFKDDNSSTVVKVVHTSVDYENERIHPRFPSHLSLEKGKRHIMLVEVTGGVVIPVLHPSLLVPYLVYNALSTPEYTTPGLVDVIFGIQFLFDLLDNHLREKITLEEYIFPRETGPRCLNSLNEEDLIRFFERQDCLEEAFHRLRNLWIEMIRRLRRKARDQQATVTRQISETLAREGIPPHPNQPRTKQQQMRWHQIVDAMEQGIRAFCRSNADRQRKIQWFIQLLDKLCPSLR